MILVMGSYELDKLLVTLAPAARAHIMGPEKLDGSWVGCSTLYVKDQLLRLLACSVVPYLEAFHGMYLLTDGQMHATILSVPIPTANRLTRI